MKPTRPNFITGSNIVNEMKPKPTRPIFSATPSTPIKPALTFTSSVGHFSTQPTYKPTTQPTYRPPIIPSTFKPVIVTVPTTSSTQVRPTRPPYTGPPTYKPTYKPGFHLTPTPLPTFPTVTTTTVSTTPNPYKPTFKPATLATFRPTLPWFSPNPEQIITEKTTTPRNPLPSYPFPILPQFDPSTAKPTVLEDTTMTTTTTTTTQITTATTTSNYPVLNIAGLDGVAIPASAEALEFYIVTMTEKIGNLIGAVVPGSEESSQDTAQTFAAVSTVVGLPLATGLMSLLGVGPAIIIGLSWLAPLILLITVPSLAG